jgi:predicted amidohydrolase
VPLISLVQQNCQKGRFADNLARAAKFVSETDADIVCFPEMSLTGYLDPVWQAESVLRLDSPQVRDFCRLSAGRTLIAGIVEHHPAGKPFITQIVATDGKLAGAYRKVNVAPDEQDMFDAGSERPVFTAAGVRFGIAVCYDVGHGDLFDAYAQAGADLVLLAAAPGLYGAQETRDWRSGFQWWRGECRRHLADSANRNGIWIGVATQSGRTVDEDFPGGGYLFAPDGSLVAETPDHTEQMLTVSVETRRP